MKKFKVFVVLAVMLVVVSAMPVFAQGEEPPAPPAGDVTLPVDLEGLIKIGLIFLVTEGLKSVSRWAGKDLTGSAARIAASISGAVILFFNTLLSAVPEAAQDSVEATLALLVSILAAFGVHGTIKLLATKKPESAK